MSAGLLETWGSEIASEEQVRESTEANLVPAGKWPGELQARGEGYPADKKVIETEDKSHPLEGKEIFQCHVLLHTDEGDKHYFFDAYPLPVKVTTDAGSTYMRQESTNGGYLYSATKKFGQPFGTVLQHALENTLVYSIGIKKASVGKDGREWPAKNTLKGITAYAG